MTLFLFRVKLMLEFQVKSLNCTGVAFIKISIPWFWILPALMACELAPLSTGVLRFRIWLKEFFLYQATSNSRRLWKNLTLAPSSSSRARSATRLALPRFEPWKVNSCWFELPVLLNVPFGE